MVKGRVACVATDKVGSRDVERPRGLCPFNKGKATGKLADLVVHCKKCGAYTCRQCVKKLRLACRGESRRNRSKRLVTTAVLDWLLADRTRVDDLFSPSALEGIAGVRNDGVVQFTDCFFCTDVDLPPSASFLERLRSPGLAFPTLVPDGPYIPARSSPPLQPGLVRELALPVLQLDGCRRTLFMYRVRAPAIEQTVCFLTCPSPSNHTCARLHAHLPARNVWWQMPLVRLDSTIDTTQIVDVLVEVLLTSLGVSLLLRAYLLPLHVLSARLTYLSPSVGALLPGALGG